MGKRYKLLDVTVKEIETLEDGTLFLTFKDEQGPYNIRVPQNTVIVDNDGEAIELQQGQAIQAVVLSNKPMMAIFPPQYAPDLIVVQTTKKGFLKLGIFNESFVNEENDLKLNIHEETVIVDVQGNQMNAPQIIGKLVAVFYWRTTFSIPAQTPPEKIIVLENNESLA